MSTPSPRFSLSAIAAALLAAGALVAPQLSLAQTLGGASGPAGDATKVEKCDAPKGTLAVVEPQDAVLQALPLGVLFAQRPQIALVEPLHQLFDLEPAQVAGQQGDALALLAGLEKVAAGGEQQREGQDVHGEVGRGPPV